MSGVSSGAWGYSPRMVAGMNTPLQNNLTYELGMVSHPPTFNNGKFISPLDMANQSWYTFNFGSKRKKKNSFGSCRTGCKRGAITRETCKMFLDSGRRINPVTGHAIQSNGKPYRDLIAHCESYGMLNEQQPLVPSPPVRDFTIIQPAPRKPAPDYSNLFQKYSVIYPDCANRDHRTKKLIMGNQTFTRGTPAYYDAFKTPGAIIKGMGCKQITMTLPDNSERHVNLGKFFEYNS